MELMKSFQISAAGMATERTRLEIVSANIANAHSTRAEDGEGAYQRRMPVVQARSFDEVFAGKLNGVGAEEARLPMIQDVITDSTPGPLVYDPGHPDANPEGYVQMPNVNVVQEMAEMMTASRAYEANLNAIESTRDMAMRALEIGRS